MRAAVADARRRAVNQQRIEETTMKIGKDFLTYPAPTIAVSMLLAFGACGANASGATYIVGTCASGTQFNTIQSALDASPAPTTVEVCPGQYYEQLVITKPVTLEGITAANGTLAQIFLPAGYTGTNLTVEGSPTTVVAQINVKNVIGGAVNLSNLQVNGAGLSSNDANLIAVAYQQSSGTVNHLVTSSQDGLSMGIPVVNGWGMWILGGSSNPTVTVENSSFDAFSGGGIFSSSDADTTTPQLTLRIENNAFSVLEAEFGISIDEGVSATVSGNIVTDGAIGISFGAASGSVTGNTIIGAQTGILLYADGASVTSNNVFGSTQTGIDLNTSLSVSKVTTNTVRTVKTPLEQDSTGTAIELNCLNISSSKVYSNVLMDAWFGYAGAPAGFAGSNTYVGLWTDVGTCTSPSVRSQANAALREKLLRQLPGHQGSLR
jgi:Periplasmic copper-binding protein (NosD)